MVDNILRSFKRAFRNNWINKIPEKTKWRAFTCGFLNDKRSKCLKENDKRAYTAANGKLKITSVRVNSLKHEV